MSVLSNWTQVGPTIQKLYANGELGIVSSAFRDGHVAYRVSPGKYATCIKASVTEQEAMDCLDKAIDPQPDHILGGEANGCDWTFYAHKGKAATVRPYCGGGWHWEAAVEGSMPFGFRVNRADAELAARNCVMQDDSK